jgi:hypothetical protein
VKAAAGRDDHRGAVGLVGDIGGERRVGDVADDGPERSRSRAPPSRSRAQGRTTGGSPPTHRQGIATMASAPARTAERRMVMAFISFPSRAAAMAVERRRGCRRHQRSPSMPIDKQLRRRRDRGATRRASRCRWDRRSSRNWSSNRRAASPQRDRRRWHRRAGCRTGRRRPTRGPRRRSGLRCAFGDIAEAVEEGRHPGARLRQAERERRFGEDRVAAEPAGWPRPRCA